MKPQVTVIDYGRSNLLSVQRALEHCGGQVSFARTPEQVMAAHRLLLPGVGAFADGMEALARQGLARPLVEKAQAGTPLLAICLGMQMLFDSSTEGGFRPGLGLIPGQVEQLPSTDVIGQPQPVPHIGWNLLLPSSGRADFSDSLLRGIRPREEVYFVHSYAAKPACPQDRLADTLYGGRPVCAAVQRGRILGCQFHPEKSAGTGLAIIRTFLQIN